MNVKAGQAGACNIVGKVVDEERFVRHSTKRLEASTENLDVRLRGRERCRCVHVIAKYAGDFRQRYSMFDDTISGLFVSTAI